jgi:hypothetical protein
MLLWRNLAVCCAALAVVSASLPMTAAPARNAPQASPAVDGVLTLFESRPVVALGEAHGLAQQEAFYTTLVADPRFAQQVSNVVVEFGGAIAQDTIDRYVAGDDVPFEQLRRVWTDTAGAFSPGEPVPLGVVNFFAAVRAANQHLPAGQRIKVWLGDPLVDWTKIHTFQDLRPFLRQRNSHIFDILDQEILRKHKKALVIVGLGHLFGPGGQGPLTRSINEAYPNNLSIVAPWLGYVESDCNARLAARMGGWPVPALVGPVQGTWLTSPSPGSNCNFLTPEQRAPRPPMAPGMNIMGPPGGPPTKAGPPGSAPPEGAPVMLGGSGVEPPSHEKMLEGEVDIMSGRKADAILYLGPPDTLTRAPFETSAYMDLEFFKQQDARARCCSPSGAGLDLGHLVRDNTPSPPKFDRNE